MKALTLSPRYFQQLQALRITTMKKITGSRAELNSIPNWFPHGKIAVIRIREISPAKVN